MHHYFSSLVRKETPFKLGTVATSVLLLNPATDEETGRTPEGARIDYKAEIEQNLWLWDVRREGNRLVTVGDSITQGFMSGAIFRTDISWPAIVGYELGLAADQFRFPTYEWPTGPGGWTARLFTPRSTKR